MDAIPPFADALNEPTIRSRLKASGLRPTRQRIALATVLFAGHDRHLAAEDLHYEVRRLGASLSLATVYNTLRQFDEAGLIRRVTLNGSRSHYDTSVSDHQHFYVEDEDRLIDIPAEAIRFGRLPEPPEGYVISRIDVLIRLRRLAPQLSEAERLTPDIPRRGDRP
ncbi:iron response transcriptional regulator IrrA [Bosea sp. 685]|uniref:iron response transcriptional regulator IrrA n=1 Tax=Bosea sp. 685 TaxID=3080057 RepID=UPI002892D43B|nr:Fur family transcriptional regulator [Bosea sp. 685]WNJ92246.1 Fur family transcriptional regulator [Bosea sp. 685]